MSRRQRFFGEKPNKVNGQIATRTSYYKDYLRRLIKGLFEVECEEKWNIDYMMGLLLFEGYFIVTDSDVGVIPVRSSMTGFNYTNFPTKAKISVPILGSFNRTIGKDCEVIYLDWKETNEFYTVDEMVRIYAEKLASCDGAIDVNIMNSKMAYIAEAESKAQAETIKEIYDNLSEGNPLVVYRKDVLSTSPLQLLTNNLKQNFIATDLQDAKRSIVNEFLTHWGVNNANTDKKERLITTEADSNLEELCVNVAHFETTLKRCLDRVHRMFPETKLDISFRYGSESREVCPNDTIRDNGNMGIGT